MEKIRIHNQDYIYVKDYKENIELRNAFNDLTNKVWEFDFESWYKSGYWNDKCHLYSLMHNSKMVSHITVSEFDCVVLGKKQKYIQLGTVMTDDEYRNRGLNKILMDKVLMDWTDHCDLIYLYANDTVLDYYPKFGFSPVDEFKVTRMLNKSVESFTVRKMNIDNTADLQLLEHLANNAHPLFDISIIDNLGTVMFYCKCLGIFKDNLYYIGGLNAIVVAKYEERNLIVHDILSSDEVDLDLVISPLVTKEIENIVMHLSPQIKKDSDKVELHKDEDLTLFVSTDKKNL